MATTTQVLRDDVFGIQRDVPMNYVTRVSVDDTLISSLSQDQHIVIHGSSKQGKTSLRKHCLNDDDYIVVQCSNRWSISDLHAAILKKAGYKLIVTEKRTVSGGKKIKASFIAKVLGVGTSVEGEKSDGNISETTSAKLELDPSDVNDVIRALQLTAFNKFIVLEDFHYLPSEVQRDFAVGLKAFHESSKLCFVIVGVWLEENRLIVYNGDLTGRVMSINADRWSSGELREVIALGETLLNIEFTDQFIDQLLEKSHNSVYVVQEACRKICEKSRIGATPGRI